MLTFSLNRSCYEGLRKMVNVDFDVRTDVGSEWLGTAYINAVEGKYDGRVGVDAYAKVCEQKSKMSKAKREVALVSVEDIEDGARGIADTIASYVDDNIDDLIERSEFKYIVDQFIDMQEYILLEEGYSLFRVLRAARKNNKTAISILRELDEKYKYEYNVNNCEKGVKHTLFDMLKPIILNCDCYKLLEVAYERGIIC